jgi:RNA polymerase sigma-70 factor (ECF subfamily)
VQYQVKQFAQPLDRSGVAAVPQNTVPQNTVPQNSVPQNSVPWKTVPQNAVPLVVAIPEPRCAAGTGSTGAGNAHADDVAGEGGARVRLRRAESTDAEALFNSQYPALAGWVRRLVDDDETAHEIASEAFTRLLARWSRLENPHSYLYMIATNLVRDHWRKMERERRAMRAVARSGSDQPCFPDQDVDVRALIQALPLPLRNAFLLHYYAGFGVREVAEMLGRAEGTVKADLFHARARLRSALGTKND